MSTRRVMGIETEYGVTCAATNGGEPPLDADAAAELMFAPVNVERHSTSAFLKNGGRLYLDVGSHPEYASAECDSITDLVAQDAAGQELVARLTRAANATLAARGVAGKLHVFRNNEDSAGHSFGCHENYMLRRRSDFKVRINRLVPFFVSRQLVAGSGFIHRVEGGAARFELSSRSYEMREALSSATTRSRPMINTRDEPHGDAAKMRRMHVIVGDSNVSTVTTGLKVAITEAMVTMLEEGAIIPDLELTDSMAAIRRISADPTGTAKIERTDGADTTALDIQRTMRDAVGRYYDRHGYTAELDATRRHLFDLWTRTLDAIADGHPERVETEIDWVAKRRLLERYRARSGADWNDPRLARLELAYHDITEDGLGARMEAGGLLARLVTPEQVRVAVTTPPQTTRAKVRGDLIAAAERHHRDIKADWAKVELPGIATAISLPDPLAAADASVDALIAQMAAAA